MNIEAMMHAMFVISLGLSLFLLTTGFIRWILMRKNNGVD